MPVSLNLNYQQVNLETVHLIDSFLVLLALG